MSRSALRSPTAAWGSALLDEMGEKRRSNVALSGCGSAWTALPVTSMCSVAGSAQVQPEFSRSDLAAPPGASTQKQKVSRSVRRASTPWKLTTPSVVDCYMDTTRKVLLVSGSLRARSTNSALLRTAAHVAPTGVEAVLFDGVAHLPYFDPDHDSEPLHPAVEALRVAIRGCDAILFSTPEYAGALPGAFKNLLEWAVGDADASSIYEKTVGWVNVSASPTGAADAYRSLAIVLGYVHAAVVDEACVQIPVTREMVGCDGLIADPEVRKGVIAVFDALVS